MSACKKCGYDEDLETCEFCGFLGPQAHVLGNFGGELKTICCQKNPTKERKRLARVAARVSGGGENT